MYSDKARQIFIEIFNTAEEKIKTAGLGAALTIAAAAGIPAYLLGRKNKRKSYMVGYGAGLATGLQAPSILERIRQLENEIEMQNQPFVYYGPHMEVDSDAINNQRS